MVKSAFCFPHRKKQRVKHQENTDVSNVKSYHFVEQHLLLAI